MGLSIIWYLKEFCRGTWIKTFLFAKTAPLVDPPYFRGYPTLTGKECTHCLSCMMICPTPGAIEVLCEGETWAPKIFEGHCIRCGLCIEACPEDVLDAGRVLETQARDGTSLSVRYQVAVNPDTCVRCGNCVVACPVNKEADPQLSATGTSANDEVIMRIHRGNLWVFHDEKCTGCKTCEGVCPTGSIRIARVAEGRQGAEE
ncbi:MAG: energy-converting hydrogenase subunit [Methanofollis sp.]|nr:energy-converting hydrogenase subunit [Methanofollis sp.]